MKRGLVPEPIEIYMSNFRLGADWRSHLSESFDPQVVLRTPFGRLKGAKAAVKFLQDLNDILYAASVKITDLVEEKGRFIFHWRADGPLSEVRDGAGWFRIKNGRIVEQELRCSIDPLVMNHG